MHAPDKTLIASHARGIPIRVVAGAAWKDESRKLPAEARRWAEAHGFAGDGGRHLVIPDAKGGVALVMAGASEANSFALGKLSRILPRAVYQLEDGLEGAADFALAWCLDAYDFDAYRKGAGEPAALVCPEGVDRPSVLRIAEAVYLTRNLINTPSNDMGPDELEKAARAVAKAHGARLAVTKGAALERGFPMIHAVGKASPRAPRLVDFTWGKPRHPKVTLVGKGVCFDTGGLDIKPASGMLLMKKDMGGAANVLGLAQMIMAARLPVRLRVLLPIVENAIAGNAFRPGDVLKSRKGLTVEIGNTDAEGRLILADALALADEEAPDLLLDMATLTGAARVALGPDLPPFFTDDETLAVHLAEASRRENDPVWRLPFWQPYGRLFESGIADINNSSESGYAGSITAALFLKRFVERAKSYIHFDIFGWTPSSRAGSPKGGEAQGIRALFTLIQDRYGK